MLAELDPYDRMKTNLKYPSSLKLYQKVPVNESYYLGNFMQTVLGILFSSKVIA